MKVVGITTQQEVFLASKTRNFRINEWLMIEDPVQGRLPGEVVEARTYNRFIPMATGDDFVDDSVIASLRAIGYAIDDETIYIAKLRLFEEATFPVETGCDAVFPEFDEVRNLIIHGELDTGLILGEIKNTDALAKTMDAKYEGLVELLENDEVVGQTGVPYILDLRSMHQYPHIGIFGGSGSGKSFGLRVVLEELMAQEMPAIVLDPHYEMDFTIGGADYKDRWLALQLGKDIGVPFEDLSSSDLKQLLDTSSKLTDAMIGVVDSMHKPKDNLHAFNRRLDDLLAAQELGEEEKVVNMINNAQSTEEREMWKRRHDVYKKYNNSCHNASVKGVKWRLSRLEREKVFAKDLGTLIESLENRKLVVIQGNTRILQVFSTFLIYRLYHMRRNWKDAQYLGTSEPYFPPFMIITDEAHNFAPKGVEVPSKSIIREVAQEGRKYGVYLLLATQRPTLLDETVTAQLNTKFIFRTVRASDIDTIREETDLTGEEAKRLPYLKTGDVFISSAVVGRTSFVRIRRAHTESPHTENPIDELMRKDEENTEEIFRAVKTLLPLNDGNLINVLNKYCQQLGEEVTIEEMANHLEILAEKGKIRREETIFGYKYSQLENES